MNKRGVFFSVDAIIAVSIILLTLLIAFPVIKYSKHDVLIQSDVVKVLSTLKVSEINNNQIKAMLINNQINDPNKTLIEQIAEFSVSNFTKAQEFANISLENLQTDENLGIWYGTKIIYLKNSSSYESSSDIRSIKRIISGVNQSENGSTGYSGRAYLTSDVQTRYIYFGGYLGDGNISININYSGNLTDLEMQITISNDFYIYVNGQKLPGFFENSSTEYNPKTYDLDSYIGYFHNGNNTLKVVGNTSLLDTRISGGFLKIVTENSSIYEEPTKYYFPGIEGIINIYDGLYSPSDINNLTIYLHYMSNYTMFLNIGNITVYNSSSPIEKIVTLNNTYLSTLLNYQQISNKTIPIRLGLEEITGGGEGGNADVVLITDISGSMDEKINSTAPGNAIHRNCSDPQLYTNGTTTKISLARCNDLNFTKTVLSIGGNKLSLVSFGTNANNYINLTNNITLLNNTIVGYSSNGGSTCVSCAINRAYEILSSQSSQDRKKFIVVMTDGMANYFSVSTCNDLLGAGIFNKDNPFSSGESGIIINRSSSNNWELLQSPISTDINDIDFNNSNLGYGVGNSGKIIKWDGNSWTNQNTPCSNDLYGLDLYNSTMGIAVGSLGKILKYNSSGWFNLTNVSTSTTLYSVSIFNSTLIYAAGENGGNGKIYRSINGGATWTENYSGGDFWKGIKIVNSTLGYAVGHYRSGGTGYWLRWDGLGWSRVNFGLGHQDLYSIDSYNSSEIYVSGGDSGESVIYRYSAGGFSSDYSNNDVGPMFAIVTYNSSTYAMGASGVIFEKSGNSWTRTFNVSRTFFQGNSSTGTCRDSYDCSYNTTYASLNANYSSCRVHNELNTTNYVIGFGLSSSCNFANLTLYNIAKCGNGSLLISTNASELQKFYDQTAYDILQLSYSEQSTNTTGDIYTKLYPDSYIEYNYVKRNFPYGLIISVEKSFYDSSHGNFSIPFNSTIIDTRVVSYSGPKWTKEVNLNNNIIYNLSNYGSVYRRLGDPYAISIPISLINPNNNNISLNTGIAPANTTNGSSSNSIIYSLIKNMSGYSQGIFRNNIGCNWTIQLENGNNLTIHVPTNYSGNNACFYQEGNFGLLSLADTNDAMNIAVYNLLKIIDFDSNGKIDIQFSENNLDIGTSEIKGVPYSEKIILEVRTWS